MFVDMGVKSIKDMNHYLQLKKLDIFYFIYKIKAFTSINSLIISFDCIFIGVLIIFMF